MDITIPEFSLVVLIGASGSGKSTFARTHFKLTEVISSDACRALVSDDENDLSATEDAFAVLHFIAGKRLAAKRLTVVDATNVQPEARKPLVELAREYDAMPVAIVLNVPEAVCRERNATRSDRADMKPHVIKWHVNDLRRSLGRLEKEGFRKVFVLGSVAEVEAASIVREKMWTDKSDDHGPFDIIGDTHGCLDELTELLRKLGYSIDTSGEEVSPTSPQCRKAIFVGDFVDRGPDSVGVLKLVMGMVEAGAAIAVPGNHDIKLMRALRGRNVQRTHGLAETMEQFEAQPPEFREKAAQFIDRLVSHFMFDDNKLVVAHAGMKERYAGRATSRVRDFALFGETTGETDEFGLPVRMNWAADYRGKAMVVYGHTPVPRAEWLNNTINIDTGCCYGGALTALRYPEREIVSVQARKVYAERARPLSPDGDSLTGQQQLDELLNIADYLGKRIVETELAPQVIIREENSIAALEVMSRFAVNPKWLIYLPPTMSPCATSQRPDLLEHPDEAFEYYRSEHVSQVVCEEKHMGSRAVLIVCRDEGAATKRFGVVGEGIGVCYTRTGRRFFDDLAIEASFLARVRDAMTQTGLWQELDTDWVCLDAELMPWSAKAQGLLESQYAAVGAAARAALGESSRVLEMAASNGIDVSPLLGRVQDRTGMIDQYVDAYCRYCWPVNALDDLTLAPFHLLASEGTTHVDKDHVWHMETLARLCKADDKLLLATPYKVIDVDSSESVAEGTAWWEELTGRGGEGMVVKPRSFIAKNSRGFAQPAVKVRGREYLRIIYGPEYAAPDQIERLRSRGLGRKRGMAAREFALGVEALQRFVRREPLRRVHECVFGVLALESEPVDPRL